MLHDDILIYLYLNYNNIVQNIINIFWKIKFSMHNENFLEEIDILDSFCIIKDNI